MYSDTVSQTHTQSLVIFFYLYLIIKILFLTANKNSIIEKNEKFAN